MWHINCLEMLAVFQVLKHFLPDLRGHHVLVRTDNTSVVSYINRQGGLRGVFTGWRARSSCGPRGNCSPWGQFTSLSTSIREQTSCREWMLHTKVMEHFWKKFGRAQVDLFASRETSQRPLWFSLTNPVPLGMDAMVQMWPRLRLDTFPPIALLPGVLERVRRDKVSLLLVAPYWPSHPWFADLVGLPEDSRWEIPIWRDLLSQAGGTIFHPRPELWKLWVWPMRGHTS